MRLDSEVIKHTLHPVWGSVADLASSGIELPADVKTSPKEVCIEVPIYSDTIASQTVEVRSSAAFAARTSDDKCSSYSLIETGFLPMSM